MVLSDLRLPDGSGIDLLRAAKAKEYPYEVIIMTGYATLDTAIQAMQEGASNYVTKPFNIGELFVRIERALQQKQLRRKVRRLKRELHERFHPDNIISNSANMQKVLEQVKNIAPTDSSVLITGESEKGIQKI
ncbi:MAG TPA: response regulator [Bacteroidetes bacterium]|nr:response regulator [Bacteroidota bacterium]